MHGTSMGADRNSRTALILAAIALAFFAGIMLNYWLLK